MFIVKCCILNAVCMDGLLVMVVASRIDDQMSSSCSRTTIDTLMDNIILSLEERETFF